LSLHLKIRHFGSSDSGSSMVQFAIAGGVLSALLLGIFEFGAAAWAKNNVAADAREGARYAIVHGARSGTPADQTMISNYVKARSALGSSIRVYASWPDGNKDPDSRVVVSVAYTVPRRGPFIRAHVDSSTSKMHILF
jgi:Flp pilus assembly protein TadG